MSIIQELFSDQELKIEKMFILQNLRNPWLLMMTMKKKKKVKIILNLQH